MLGMVWFPSAMAKHKNQLSKLVDLLRSSGEIALPEIQRLGIAQHGARLKELRERGFVIRNRMEHSADGTTHSFYSLLAEPGEPMRLFDLSPFERHRDDN